MTVDDTNNGTDYVKQDKFVGQYSTSIEQTSSDHDSWINTTLGTHIDTPKNLSTHEVKS